MKYVFKKKKLTLLVGTADIAGSIVFWPVMIIRKLLNAGKIPKNILVVRLDQTGDCIQAIPFLKSLRFKHPNARISLLVLKNNEFLFISNPAVNSVLTVDSSWFTKTGPDFIKKFFNITSVIKAGGFDMAFDLRGDLRTIAALFFGGVKKISGYGCAGGGFLLDETREYDRELHEMDKNLRLLDEKEISGPVAIDFSQPGEKKAVEFIKTVNADKSIRIIVHPFAGASSKLWGMEKYRLLVEKIFEYNGKAVVFITGGPADAGQWQFFNGTGAINAIAMPIDVSMALIGKCSIFIGSDSFAQYTAAYSGLNTCVISGYTSNYERWKPKIESKKLRIFHKPVECGPCELAVCNQSSHKCMDIITVDEVFESIKNWLK
jgi:ADP-heptose:LPS heptosyltransferase